MQNHHLRQIHSLPPPLHPLPMSHSITNFRAYEYKLTIKLMEDKGRTASCNVMTDVHPPGQSLRNLFVRFFVSDNPLNDILHSAQKNATGI